MNLKLSIPFILGLTIALASPSPAAKPAPKAQCPIDRATYSAIGKPEFELQFSPIENSKYATELVAFTFQHRDRGMLATYHLGGSMGYGSYYLRDLAKPIEDDADGKLKPVFFDTNWRSVKVDDQGTAPEYLFISGLGVTDWYGDRTGNRNQPVGEVMWQLSGCRPQPH
ncbi:MAG: hypothetical protein HC860_12805 [Alkalinema sp. RU_4_3]|nr:hypothetical protein [Alkalinema sp. RU_4_3]